jgi:hypothetical protein
MRRATDEFAARSESLRQTRRGEACLAHGTFAAHEILSHDGDGGVQSAKADFAWFQRRIHSLLDHSRLIIRSRSSAPDHPLPIICSSIIRS